MIQEKKNEKIDIINKNKNRHCVETLAVTRFSGDLYPFVFK